MNTPGGITERRAAVTKVNNRDEFGAIDTPEDTSLATEVAADMTGSPPLRTRNQGR